MSAQAERAAAWIDGGEGFFVPLNVSLEPEWVLRGAYRLGVDQVVRSFEGLLSVCHLHFEHETVERQAHHQRRPGLDFADARHHQAASDGTGRLGFDAGLIADVQRLRLEPPVRGP
jgi:hypothetical protein